MPISPKAARVLRIIVFLLLASSALTVFLLGDRIWTAIELGSLPLWAGFAAPVVFTVFVLFFLLDRFFQVQKGKYPMTRAFVQVVLALVFLSIIWPQHTKAFEERQHLDLSSAGLEELLKSRDPRLRAVACELLSFRSDADFKVLSQQAKIDGSGAVRKVCKEASLRLAD
tara:strand:+ start:56 stop:565 length:510 start_codon:yes stop_codon:yes gene_type:complete